MANMTIFLCIFALFYLVNLSLSRVLDFPEERKNLCTIAGIVNRTCSDAEDKLVNEAFKAKQELENERELRQNVEIRLQKEKNEAEIRLQKEKNETAQQRERAVNAEKDKGNEVALRKARDIAIGLRSRIEIIEKKLFPEWLLNTLLSRKQRWLIALTLRTTKYSVQVQSRMKEAGLSPYELADDMNEFYDSISTRFEHLQKAVVPKTQAEWDALYELLGAIDDHKKKALQLTFEPMTIQSERKDKETKTFHYFILFGNVDFSAEEKDVKKVFQSIDDKGTLKIHIITKYKGLPTGYIAAEFITEKKQSATELKSTLVRNNQRPFQRKGFEVNVYTESGEASEATQKK